MTEARTMMNWDTIYLFGLFLGRKPSQRDIEEKSRFPFLEAASKVLVSKEFGAKERAFSMALPEPLLARDVAVTYQDWLRSKLGVQPGAPLYLGDRLVSDTNRFDHMVLFCTAIEQRKGVFFDAAQSAAQLPVIQQILCEGALHAAVADPALAALSVDGQVKSIAAAQTLPVAMQSLAEFLCSDAFGAQIAQLSYGADPKSADRDSARAADARNLMLTLLDAAQAPELGVEIHRLRALFISVLDSPVDPAQLHVAQARYHPAARQLILKLREASDPDEKVTDISLSLSSLPKDTSVRVDCHLTGPFSETAAGILVVTVPLPANFPADAAFAAVSLGAGQAEQPVFIEGEMKQDNAPVPVAHLAAKLEDMIVFRVPAGLVPQETTLSVETPDGKSVRVSPTVHVPIHAADEATSAASHVLFRAPAAEGGDTKLYSEWGDVICDSSAGGKASPTAQAQPDALPTDEARSLAAKLAEIGAFEMASAWLNQSRKSNAKAKGSKAFVQPGKTPSGPNAENAGTVTQTDIIQCYWFFTHRAPSEAEILAATLVSPLTEVINHVLASQSFIQDILPQINAAAQFPQDVSCQSWAADALPLSRTTVTALRRATDSNMMLRLVLDDQVFQAAVTMTASIPSLRRVDLQHLEDMRAKFPPVADGLMIDSSVMLHFALPTPEQATSKAVQERRKSFEAVFKTTRPNAKTAQDLLSMLNVYVRSFGADSIYFKTLAECLIALGMFEHLLILSNRALRTSLNAEEAFWFKSIAEEKLGLLEEGVTSLLTSLSMQVKVSANRTLEAGRKAFQASHGAFGKYPAKPEYADLARELLLRARELGRKDGLVEYELTRLYMWQGARTEALAAAAQAVACKPTSKYVRIQAQCLVFFGEYRMAADLVQQYDFTDDAYLFLKTLMKRFSGEGTYGETVFRSIEGEEINLEQLPVNTASLNHVGEIRIVTPEFPDDPVCYRNLDFWDPVFVNHKIGSVQLDCLLGGGQVETAIRIQRDRQAQSVMLVSKQGTNKFGGAEHFLYQAAQEYKTHGLDVQFMGFERGGNHNGEDTGPADMPCTWVDYGVESFRNHIFEQAPAVVHSVTGMGLEMMEALKGSAAYHIHGVHFWRDMKFSRAQPENSWFKDLEDLPTRLEFNLVLTGFGTTYANSVFTRDLVRKEFGVLLPIVPSIAMEEAAPAKDDAARDNADALPATQVEKIVLLANSRQDKGGYLVLDVAERLPHIPFFMIQNQDTSKRLQIEISKRGLRNVELVARVDDMGALYRRAQVVLTPSYDFVESFSRVPIEAHRNGIPVIGSDVGNVRNLLEESGIILPEDPDLWAAEIDRLYSDADYHAKRSEAAKKNSDRWSYEIFQSGIDRLVRAQKTPTLVAIGTGIGNMLHTTPMIKWLSEYLDAPVDIVLSGDWAEADQLFAGSPYVNMIFPLDERILMKPYKQVFVSHSFGDGRFDFTAEDVHYSREWRRFDPSGEVHEGAFNIDFVAEALGVDRSAATGGYFLADRTYNKPEECRRIGFHAGSKSNHWAVKRWPYFQQLAEALISRGYEVVCFGGDAEAVPFTQKSTGLILQDSIDGIMECDYFISNDSGVMNIANALAMPQAALFGPTNPVTRGPDNPECLIIMVDKDCAPCETKPALKPTKIDLGECDCMKTLTLEFVLDQVLSHIESIYGTIVPQETGK